LVKGTVRTGEKKKGEGVQAPEKYVAMYRGKVEDEKLARYCGAVTCMDEAIGALMEAVEKAGQKDNTIFLFMSDNGGSGNGGNAPLKGSKSSMWEGGLRVPFICPLARQSACGQGDGRIPHLALELVPTLLAATGAKAPEGVKLDGFDMLPSCGEAKSRARRCSGSAGLTRRLDLRTGSGWSPRKGNGLYDLSTDLGERSTTSPQEKPEIAKMMQERFAAWRGRWMPPSRAVRFGIIKKAHSTGFESMRKCTASGWE
jgi:arylsulfatase A-like enzyme